MYIFKILLSFIHYSNNDLLAFVYRVVLALTGNPDFPVTVPTLVQITALKDDFETAVAEATDGGKAARIVRDEKRALLEIDLRLLASYIEDHSANNRGVMLRTGFNVYGGNKPPKTSPNTPVILSLYYGKLTATADVKIDPVDNADVYECRFTTDEFGPDATWIHLPVSTKSSMIIAGLTLGSSIWAQVRCINSRGISNWSDPAHLTFIH